MNPMGTTTSSFIQPSDRIASFKPYFFASLTTRLAALRAKGVDIIRLDMGSPDLPPADFITDVLVENVRRPDMHGYSPMGGTPQFRRACADYYKRRFQVDLDPQKEVLALLGSKEGLFHLSQVILNPGDVSLVPDPGYPVYSAGGIIAGAEIYYLPLLPENHFLPDLQAIPPEIIRRAKLLWIDYPNNPTGAIAPLSFFEEAVEFARRNQILVAHDAPYVDVCFDGYQAPSLMQVPGAKEVAIEFNSVSKTYNMAGWRIGMAVGNSLVLSYLHTMKSQIDSSNFEPLLVAGGAAMTGDQTWIGERNAVYQTRRDIIVNALRRAGFYVDLPPAAIYVWARLPEGEKDSTDFCTRMLDETGVSTTPGIVYGKNGEGYLRISLGTPTDKVQEAMDRVVTWLKR